MGRLFVITLEGNLYSCKYCKTHFALSDDIISKSFHCKYGSAYLFNKVVNVTVGDKEDRVMMTGIHTVVDVFCVGCGSLVGWKYQLVKKAKNTRKERSFLRGLRCWVLMEANIFQNPLWLDLEVIVMMFD
ncbi:Hypothetical predicted protein [Olea europaea subsp. europaea]|uniref:Protein yippee-like n=1 Tax=Olea europaea subsp. europaea TaxID=158383 RepID=A0A8S0TZC7_OLEEU|nr:Hypothetical predicted protein [Olea europaea subsp. europaea]